jgi:lysophospholipase L1-like esterase
MHALKSYKNSKILSLLIMLTFIISIVTPAKTHAIGEKVHYVALGDSLAAGQIAKKADGTVTFDKGFTGVIAEHFEKQGTLASYSNKYAVSGYTTQNVLDDLMNNKEVEGKKIQDTLKTATVISITAGANDVLRIAKIDAVKGTVTIDPLQFGATNVKIQENLGKILQQIKAINPKAEVYVSGYYNPFPYLSADQQSQLRTLLTLLNNGIQNISVANGATFVSLNAIFDANIAKYLPNPLDIHPSQDGYQLVANYFIQAYADRVRFNFVDVPENLSGYSEIKYLVENKIMTGLTDTHFGPQQGITRADAAVAIMNILPFEKSIPEDPGFSDVPKSHPAYTAIAALTQAKVFNKAEKFNPDAKFTRAQMAKVFTLAFQLKATQSSNFTDVKSDNWAKTYVDALLSAKITTGYTNDNTFKPNLETTRAHFAMFLVRASKNIKPVAVK